jgi:hypothetical protein
VDDTKHEYRGSSLFHLSCSVDFTYRCFDQHDTTHTLTTLPPRPPLAIPLPKSHPSGLEYPSIDFFLLHCTSELAASPTKQEVPLPARATSVWCLTPYRPSACKSSNAHGQISHARNHAKDCARALQPHLHLLLFLDTHHLLSAGLQPATSALAATDYPFRRSELPVHIPH